MIIYGIDPDSKAHGVAVYDAGQLVRLEMRTLTPLVLDIRETMGQEEGCIVAVEDVAARSYIYQRNTQASKAAQSKVAVHIGRCQQAQIELVRALAYFNIDVMLFKPAQGNWAKNKKQFEKFTGWKKSSNADTRAAAYFGYLACQKRYARQSIKKY